MNSNEKEKAIELVNKFSEFKVGISTCYLSKIEANQCALIAINEILQTNPTLKGTSEDLITMIVQTKAYWYRVQDEINAL